MNKRVGTSPYRVSRRALSQPGLSLEKFEWLISLIRRLRPDLCELFPLNKPDQGLQFISWLLSNGALEYQAVLEDQNFLQMLSQEIYLLGLTPLQALIYLQRIDVQTEYPLPKHVADVVRWFYQHGVHEHNLWKFLLPEELDRIPEHIRAGIKISDCTKQMSDSKYLPFGVNLIGYAYGQLGIGEDIRMAAKCMQAAEILFTIINCPPGKDIPQNDFSVAAHVSETGNYAINIFCMSALETARYYAEKGDSLFAGKYNIGYWPWELSEWPEEWMDLFVLVDEVWVSSRHTYDAVALVSPVPVLIMPMSVTLDSVSDKTKADFDLPLSAYLYCFSFDLNSSIYRKNPQVCLTAFAQAFPRDAPDAKTRDEVGLVIKVHRPHKKHHEWENLKILAAADDRIHIIEKTLSRPDLLALYKCCNCFLSLHRAEGFGRGIAEAMLLGLKVITTGYSGNVDFCTSHPQVNLVEYALTPVREGEYPFGHGQSWAEADSVHAAALMRSCVGQKNIKDAGSLEFFGPREVGMRYKKRLQTIYNDLHAYPSL